METDTNIQKQVARAAIAVAEADEWAKDHKAKADGYPARIVMEFAQDARDMRDRAIEMARNDNLLEAVREAADSAIRARDRCMAASKAANQAIENERRKAKAETVRAAEKDQNQKRISFPSGATRIEGRSGKNP